MQSPSGSLGSLAAAWRPASHTQTGAHLGRRGSASCRGHGKQRGPKPSGRSQSNCLMAVSTNSEHAPAELHDWHASEATCGSHCTPHPSLSAPLPISLSVSLHCATACHCCLPCMQSFKRSLPEDCSHFRRCGIYRDPSHIQRRRGGLLVRR